MGTAWMIASGKGGVGKSTITACVAQAMAKKGNRVCIVDGDVGLRDQDVLLNLQNRVVFDLLDVAQGNCRLDQALVNPDDDAHLALLPASQFARAKELKPAAFRKIVLRLKLLYDVVLIDCPAGIEGSLRHLMSDAIDETVLVTTPDDVCIRNAERARAVMEKKGMPRPRIIVNRLDEYLVRGGEMYSAATVVSVLDMPLLGEVPDDPFIYRAVLKHISPMQIDCDGRNALQRIAERMLGRDIPLPGYGTKKLNWFQRLFNPTLKEVKRIDR